MVKLFRPNKTITWIIAKKCETQCEAIHLLEVIFHHWSNREAHVGPHAKNTFSEHPPWAYLKLIGDKMFNISLVSCYSTSRATSIDVPKTFDTEKS